MDSFHDIKSIPGIKDNNDELSFTETIKMIKVRHKNVVPMMALGVQQLKKDLDPKVSYKDLDEIHQFLDRFYMSRIGIRMLIGWLFFLCWLDFYLFGISSQTNSDRDFWYWA